MIDERKARARLFRPGQAVWVQGRWGREEWPERVIRVMRSGNVVVTVNFEDRMTRSVSSQMVRLRDVAS